MMFIKVVKVGNKGPSAPGPHASVPVRKCTKSKFNIINASSYSLGNKVLDINTKSNYNEKIIKSRKMYIPWGLFFSQLTHYD